MGKIKGINHITFICKDLEKMARLLVEVFEAKEIYSSGEKTFSISKEKFFNVAGYWIAIMEGEPVSRTYNHLAFHIEEKDLSFFEEKLKALGLEVSYGRKREVAEGKSLYFYDYDNHLFELHTGDLNTRLNFYQQDSSC